MKESIEYIAKALKKARHQKKYSQRLLSHKVGIAQSHLSRIERGEVDLQASSLIEIARTLGLEVMLVPREMMQLVKDLQNNKLLQNGEQIPAFRLGEDEDDEEEND